MDKKLSDYELQIQTSMKIKFWLASLDWEMRTDYMDEECKRPVFFIHEQEDHSVGMFGNVISPSFGSIEELYRWCKNMMETYDIEFKEEAV